MLIAMKQWTVLRKGTFTGLGKKKVTVDDSMLDTIVAFANANAGEREIPIVKGHPRVDSPKYGGIALSSVKRVGDTIVVEPSWIDDGLSEEIKAKRYDGCSLKFNPRTGRIAHLGVLGAHPPAVDGLPAIELADTESDEDSIDVVELADSRMPQVGAILRRMRDALIADKGVEEADKVFPPDELAGLESYYPEVPEWMTSQIDALYSRIYRVEDKVDTMDNKPALFGAGSDKQTATTTMTVEELQAQLDAEKSMRIKAEQESQKLRAEMQQVRLGAYLDSPEMITRITPARKNEVMAVLAACESHDEEIEFANADDSETPVKKPLAESVRTILSWLPPQVELGGAVEGDSPERSTSDDEADKMAAHANRHTTRKK